MLSQTTMVKVRKAIESAYTGVCTIIERRDIRDAVTKITSKSEEVAVVENQPCRLSFDAVNTAAQTATAARVMQTIKLFLAPEIEVKPGSKIIAEQNGRKAEYYASGEPAVYPTHLEIELELCKEWA